MQHPVLKNYEVIRGVGKGAFGKVAVVRNLQDGLKYILKELPLEDKSPKEIADAHKELQILGSLNHPNIIRLIEHQETESSLYLIMEYAEGGDLERVINHYAKSKQMFSNDTIMRWIVHILLGLRYVHSQHILHRDLKTANVFITKDGIAKLGDFGFSKQLSSSVEQAKTMCGTPYYLAPEKFKGQTYNLKSDVWSVGVILYELIAFRKPWAARTLPELRHKVLNETIESLESVCTSPDLLNLVQAMLTKTPSARPSVATILNYSCVKAEINKMREECQEKEQAANKALQEIAKAYPRRPSNAEEKKAPTTSVVPTHGQGGAANVKIDPKVLKEFMSKPPPKPAPQKETTETTGPSVPASVDRHAPIDVREQASKEHTAAALYRDLVKEASNDFTAEPEDVEVQDTEDVMDKAALEKVLGPELYTRCVGIFLSDVPIEEAHDQVIAVLGPTKEKYVADIQRHAFNT
eukprot:PhF_6_TR6129/c1_g1_i2/m.9084/K08857/NEK1_4_5; NIMA (never in mitosis gene a)-related kinase 1/4/5